MTHGRRSPGFPLSWFAILAFTLVAPWTTSADAQTRAATKNPLTGFDQYVMAAMKQWKVPGLAIAAVRGDSVIMLKGYGVRTFGEAASVEVHTLSLLGALPNASTDPYR